MNIIRESEIEELDVPGRKLRWLFHPEGGSARNCSMNVVIIAPGQTVSPAHEHPNSEEIIYVVSGSGEVLIDGEVGTIATGTAVLFPQGSVHMVRNSGSDPLKLACFFAPPADFASYRYHEDVAFPEGRQDGRR